MNGEPPLVDVSGLTVTYPSGDGPVDVVRGVSFHVQRGETVAIVGESGSGKTVTSLAMVGLARAGGGRVTAGRVGFDGVDLTTLGDRQLRAIRGRRIGMIFQQPMRSLNPAFTVGRQIAEVLRRHRGLSRRDAWTRAVELLDRVHIPDAAARATDYPHTFSGGMSQRVMIAIALACEPELLIADEPTTALDVTVQAAILDLIDEIQQETAIAVVLISHDLAVIAEHADRVVVLYAGQVVEEGRSEQLFYRPRHPYTEGLLGSIPRPGVRRLSAIPGSVPRPGDAIAGCRFAPRCDHVEHGRCDATDPPLMVLDTGATRCIRATELELRGVAAT